MTSVALTPALRAEYESLFQKCVVRTNRVEAVETIVAALVGQRFRYTSVGTTSGVPWYVIAVIHSLESGQRFDRHLHNGDPLTRRTVHHPEDRPKKGAPPFTWEESAGDALGSRRLRFTTDWSLPGTLYQLERFNGFGYRRTRPEVRSPYLWSFSTHYVAGKFVKDGAWSDSVVSRQCGAAVLLRRMTELGVVAFSDQALPNRNGGPMVVPFAIQAPRTADELERAIRLQVWLTTYPGIFLRPDGIPGPRTSDAYRRVTGSYLPGDPRGA
jgi:lysozyme family protein